MMINVDVDLYEAIRAEAFDARKSMSRVVNDAVRKHIGKRKAAKPAEPDVADGT